MLLEPSIDRSEGLRMLDFIQRTERREETAECGVVCCNLLAAIIAVQTCFCRCNSWLACSADSGAEAERPMHNSEFEEFDQEQGTLDSANLKADLALIRYSAMRGEVNGDAIVDC